MLVRFKAGQENLGDKMCVSDVLCAWSYFYLSKLHSWLRLLVAPIHHHTPDHQTDSWFINGSKGQWMIYRKGSPQHLSNMLYFCFALQLQYSSIGLFCRATQRRALLVIRFRRNANVFEFSSNFHRLLCGLNDFFCWVDRDDEAPHTKAFSWWKSMNPLVEGAIDCLRCRLHAFLGILLFDTSSPWLMFEFVWLWRWFNLIRLDFDIILTPPNKQS